MVTSEPTSAGTRNDTHDGTTCSPAISLLYRLPAFSAANKSTAPENMLLMPASLNLFIHIVEFELTVLPLDSMTVRFPSSTPRLAPVIVHMMSDDVGPAIWRARTQSAVGSWGIDILTQFVLSIGPSSPRRDSRGSINLTSQSLVINMGMMW